MLLSTEIEIAHRLTTVMNCPIIFYTEDGKILDQSTYHDLLQRNKKFREMAKEREQSPDRYREVNNEE